MVNLTYELDNSTPTQVAASFVTPSLLYCEVPYDRSYSIRVSMDGTLFSEQSVQVLIYRSFCYQCNAVTCKTKVYWVISYLYVDRCIRTTLSSLGMCTSYL